MPEEVEPVVENLEAPTPEETPKPAEAAAPAPQQRPQGDRGPRPDRGKDDKPKGSGAGSRPAQAPGGDRGPRPGGDRSDRGPRQEGGPRGGGDRREGGRPNFGGGGRPFDGPVDIELEKLISDSLYLDNQAHVVVMRMRDMDSGTKSQLRRLYNAVRRAVRAPESERQHQFVMLRARLAYTIARHSLRSLDALERLLLQVTRKNDARGYERFKDLFEAIVAYNE
ncbi:MAG TPA: type III-A CRISPR-associated protein Csm2 [Bryobacteraceae bacterium]|jgi:CRISPR type III-A-associated protein Csm2|nr:type III-A CRISPR-associated protein Csm2 [Bryobacteraceae bacterium]